MNNIIKLISGVVISASCALAATYNVTSSPYNANGADGADDTSAFQSALTAAAANRGTLYIPAGTYYISSQLTNPSQKGLTIRGDGDSSVVVLTSGTNLLNLSMSSVSEHVAVRSIKFSTSSSSALAAVRIGYPATNSHRDPALMAKNLTIATTGSGSWDYGVHLSNAWNSLIRESSFTNTASTPYQGTAIFIDQTSINSLFISNVLSQWSVGIDVNCFQEGVIVDGGTIGPVNIGILKSDAGSYVPGSGAGFSYLSAQNVTFDCRQDSADCIWAEAPADGVWVSFLRGNTMKVAEDIPNQTPNPRYHFAGQAMLSIFIGNTLDGNGSAGGLVLNPQDTPQWPAIVSRNTFTDIANGASLWIKQNVYNTTVTANSFGGGWFYNQGTSTNPNANY
jgi:hypothetical protein